MPQVFSKLSHTFTAFGLILSLVLTPGAFAITDMGFSAITRLYGEGGFACTASYIFPQIPEADHMSWIVSAGHCSGAQLARRNSTVHMYGHIDWRAVTLGNPRYTQGFMDLAIGTVPDVREDHQKLWLGEKMPTDGPVYIHGFPEGVERIVSGRVITESRPEFKDEFPGAGVVLVRKNDFLPGSSGSPILDPDGNLVGVAWGHVKDEFASQFIDSDKYSLAIVTPVERLRELMKLIQVRE